MHTNERTPRLGALRSPDPVDRFDLATVISRRNPRSGALLADGVEGGGR